MLAVLSEVFGREISPGLIEVYYDTLSGRRIEEVEAAGRALLRTAKFFPRPSEFIEAMDGDPDERAAEAWAAVLWAMRKAGGYPVKFEDGAVGAAIVSMGGWLRLCDSRESDLPHLRREFMSAYKTLRRRGNAETRVLAGRWRETPLLVPAGGLLALPAGAPAPPRPRRITSGAYNTIACSPAGMYDQRERNT